MRELDPLAVKVAIVVPSVLVIAALGFWIAKNMGLVRKLLIIAVGTVFISCAYFLIDRAVGFGSMSSLYAAGLISAVLGIVAGRMLRRTG